MKMTWEDGDGIQRGFDSPIVIKRRLMTMSTDGAARIIRDATSDDVAAFLTENDVKLVPENATMVEPDEYTRMLDLARMYADQVERANREAARANYAEFMLALALDEGLKAVSDAMRRGKLVQQCIDGGHDLEISETRTALGKVGYKVRVDPVTRTVLKADIFDAIAEAKF